MSTVEDNIKTGIEEKGWKVGMKSITQLLLINVIRSKYYMFRPVVAIIMSLSFDTYKIIYIIVWRLV